VREWRCVGPLVELVRWRDERDAERLLRGVKIAPGELAAQERAQVEATVAALRERRASCELTWSVLMHQTPDNPGLRLREEALLRVLELPPRDYPVNAVGWAGVTTTGRPPVAVEGAR
jgi:hypothetical protein